MAANPFQNRWSALSLAALVIVGAVFFVDGQGAPDSTSRLVADGQPQVAGFAGGQPALPQSARQPEPPADDLEAFYGDDDLIDEAEGFAPDPIEPATGEEITATNGFPDETSPELIDRSEREIL